MQIPEPFGNRNTVAGFRLSGCTIERSDSEFLVSFKAVSPKPQTQHGGPILGAENLAVQLEKSPLKSIDPNPKPKTLNPKPASLSKGSVGPMGDLLQQLPGAGVGALWGFGSSERTSWFGV